MGNFRLEKTYVCPFFKRISFCYLNGFSLPFRLTCCLPAMSDAVMMRGREESDSPINGSRNVVKGGFDLDDDYVDDEDGAEEDEEKDNGKRKVDGGFFSALVSLIEVVAAPISPTRPRGGSSRGTASRGGASHVPRPEKPRPTAVHTRIPEETRISKASKGVSNRVREQEASAITQSASEDTREALSSGRPPRSPAPRSYATGYQDESAEWRGGWAQLTPTPQELNTWRGGRTSPPNPSVPSMPRDGLIRPKPSKSECTYNGGVLRQGRHGGTSDGVVGVVEREKPVELGFPSERPWAYGFGSG